MTNQQLLRYARLTGGMLGRSMTKSTGKQFTLDRVRWAGNTYSFIYNVEDGIFNCKQILKLSTIANMYSLALKQAEKVNTSEQLPAVLHMILKLQQLTKKD